MPPKTSPDPAVANVGGALALMMARPSGAAITVSEPLRTMTAPLRRAAARVRVSLSPLGSNRRRNSPSCGVSTQGPAIARSSAAGSSLNAVMASASSSVGRPVLSIASTRVRVSSPDPGAGSDQKRREPIAGQQAGEVFRRGKGFDHDAGQRRRVDRQRRRRIPRLWSARPRRGRPRGPPSGPHRSSGNRRRSRHGHGCVCCRRRVAAAGPQAHRTGSFSNVSGTIRSSTDGSVPMSATTTSPHSSRPGSSRCPGFLRKKVTVSTAATAPTLRRCRPSGRSEHRWRRSAFSGAQRPPKCRRLAPRARG